MEIKDVMEILFNVFYLIAVWYLVFMMSKKLEGNDSRNTLLRKLFNVSFALLALGDTGHVGFRVLAYLNGGLDKNAPLLGIGKLATGITVTIFYALFVEIWRVRFNKKHNLFTVFLFICAFVRIIILLLPQNQWSSAEAPFNWAIYRNIPLVFQGVGVIYLFLRGALEYGDNTFKWISIMILASFTFYTPVILFASKYPTIGLLMIPKTVAYLVAGFIGYNGIFKDMSISKPSQR